MFTTGSATIELDDETLVLDELAGEASFSADYGINVRWTDGEGRCLSLFAAW